MGPTIAPRPTWDQSDIVEAVYFAALDSKLPAVLLTPACDIEQDKVAFWTFSALFPDDVVVRQLFADETADWSRAPSGNLTLSKNQREQLRRKVTQLFDHRFPRYHWLPITLGSNAALVVDFSCVTCLPASEVRRGVHRIASLASSWREQIPARYSAYMSRVGTDEYVPSELQPHVDRLIEALTKPP